jgi:hypothetical protein
MFKMYKFDIFSPLHFTLVMLFFYTIVKYFLMYLGLSKYPLGTFKSTDFVTLLIVLQFTFIFIFYNIFKQFNHDKYINFTKKYFSFDIVRVSRIKATNVTIIFSIIILYELYYRLIGTSLFDMVSVSQITVKNMAGNNPMAYIFIKGFADTLLMIWAMILAYFSVILKKYRVQMALLMCIIMFLAIFNGSRGMFVMGAIFPLIIIYNGFKKRLGILPLFLLFLFVILLLGILGVVRVSSQEVTLDVIINIITELNTKISYLFLSVLDRRMDSFYPNLMHVFDNIDKFDYRYGFDYINIFLQYIPRFIWEGKPISLVREANNILVLQDSGGTGFSSIFEAWINFSIFGLVLNAIMASYVLVLFQKIYIYARNNREIVIFIIAVKIGTSIVMKFFIASGITHNSAELLFVIINFLIALQLIKIMLFKKQKLIGYKI